MIPINEKELAKKIEELREELNGIDANENKEKLLKKSCKLDILINEYLKK